MNAQIKADKFNLKFDGHNMVVSKLHIAMMIELIHTDITNVAELHELDFRGWNSQDRIQKAMSNGFIDFNGRGYFLTDWGHEVIKTFYGELKGHYLVSIWNEVSTY